MEGGENESHWLVPVNSGKFEMKLLDAQQRSVKFNYEDQFQQISKTQK